MTSSSKSNPWTALANKQKYFIPNRPLPHMGEGRFLVLPCINFDKINFQSRREKIHSPRFFCNKSKPPPKKPRPFSKKVRPFFNETSQNFHKTLTFFHKISPFFSQKKPFFVLNHHKSCEKCSILPEISEILFAHNARICHPSDFWFQISDSRGISWGHFSCEK